MKSERERRDLVLFTNCYPYGSGEEFLETEVAIAQKYYNHVYVVPASEIGAMRALPENVTVINGHSEWVNERNPTIAEFTRAFTSDILLDWAFLRKIKAIKVFKSQYEQQFKKFCSIKRIMDEYQPKMKNPILYDFWLINNGMALSILGREGKIDAIANAHSYDLYDERWGCPLPFRSTIVKMVQKVFPDSNYGLRYIKRKLSPSLRNKAELSYMGTLDYGYSPTPSSNTRTIVSCCSCAAHKRVELIVDAISELDDEDLTWVHFGDGPNYELVRELAKKKIKYSNVVFKGWVESSELINFLKTNEINALVHASRAEGVPVSLMLAASFGIPIVAFDAMGVGELVQPNHGTLLPSDANLPLFAQEIKSMIDGRSLDETYRQRSRSHWQKNFSVNNYDTLHGEKIPRALSSSR